MRSAILAALLHGTRAVSVSQSLGRGIQGIELRNIRRGRHLYSAGRQSCLASAHILVCYFLFVTQISREPLKGFAPNSQERRVWSRARKSECQGQRSKVKITRDKKRAVHSGHSPQATSSSSGRDHSVTAGACVRFMFGKTSLALVFSEFEYNGAVGTRVSVRSVNGPLGALRQPR